MTDQKTHSYFTTPIYYASGEAHVGHIYANVLMNVYRNFHHLLGEETLRLTGLDEHGEKIEKKASEMELAPQKYVDSLEPEWRKVYEDFGLAYDVFQRTTSLAHHENVKTFLQKCYDTGDIYFAEHEGNYCVDCEAFLTDKEMDESKACLIHKKKTETRKEGNYYFRCTRYYPKIKEMLKAGKIVRQERYRNETLAMIEALDGDLSISRPKTRTTWGVELPFDSKHVSYVWFDALPNYVTGVGGLEKAVASPFWQNATHICGKDILKFHAIYWPAMCLAVGLPVAELMVTGWILVDNHKMSKSLGNIIPPATLLPYGVDAFVNYTMRQSNIGEDFDLNIKTYIERFNADLANGIGNLASRTFAMIEKYNDKVVPAVNPSLIGAADQSLFEKTDALKLELPQHFGAYHQATALQKIWELIGLTDKFISDSKPWDLAKSEATKPQLLHVLASAVSVMRSISVYAWPFFPTKMSTLMAACGVKESENPKGVWHQLGASSSFAGGHTFGEVPKLFARLEVPAAAPSSSTAAKSKSEKSEGTHKDAQKGAPKETQAKSANQQAVSPDGTSKGFIGIDDFSKVEISVGTVLSAEIVDGSDKLLRLSVSLGDLGTRQIFSGIRAWVKPESLVNRKVLVVTNLAPRKMKFGMSEGMVLSADTVEGGVSPVFAPEGIKEGARLS